MGKSLDKKFPDCWVFDFNRRVYTKGGDIIWREHWRRVEIISENKRSWITRCRLKIPKAGRTGVAFSQEEIDQQEWVNVHKYRIIEILRRSDDYKVIEGCAKLVGYDPSTQTET